MIMNKIFIVTLVQCIFLNAFAQNYWTVITDKMIPEESQITAKNANYLNLDFSSFKNEVFQAPLKTAVTQWSDVNIQIPLPNGTFEEYLVFEAPVMQDGLAAKFPEIKTFILQSKTNRAHYGRADITHKGFHAMLNTTNGTLFIDPTSAVNNESYISYYKKDFFTNKDLPSCLTENEEILEDAVLQESNNDLFVPKSTKASNGLILN